MIAGLILLAAIAICALLIWAGPLAAEALLGLFGDPAAASPVLAESLFMIVLFGALLIAGIVGGRLSGVRPLRLGANPGSGIILGLLIGAAGVLVAAGYGWVAGTLTSAAASINPGLLLWGTLLVLLQAGSEEVYFRGWLQPVLDRSWGAAAAVILSALAFALLHIIGGARSPVSILNLFLGGILFGLLTLRRGGIAAAVGAHFAWNWTEQTAVGLMPNPGISEFGSLLNLELSGAAIWGGGEEGLNASLAMTFALLALLVPLLLLGNWGREVTLIPPAVPAPDRSGPAPA